MRYLIYFLTKKHVFLKDRLMSAKISYLGEQVFSPIFFKYKNDCYVIRKCGSSIHHSTMD
jgi:hypothetical protein